MRWNRELIEKHADELADRCMNFEPSEATEIPLDVFLAFRAELERRRAELLRRRQQENGEREGGADPVEESTQA